MGNNSYKAVNSFKICEHLNLDPIKCSKNGTQECSRICVYFIKE